MRRSRAGVCVALFAFVAASVLTAPASADVDVASSSKQLERRQEWATPEYQERLLRESQTNFRHAVAAWQNDPERNFVTDVCWSKVWACAGDVRLYDWERNGYGIVEPVLFTNRSGATISGRAWSTKAGPAKRPGIVITAGSLQAPEEVYWWAAQTLAKAGYVVLTSDPQNQGQSDTFGEGTDAAEGAGSQLLHNTFYDGTQDALDFLLSTPKRPFCPRASRAGGDHCAKQQRRAAADLNAAYNPFWRKLDPKRLGLAGHSAGAEGVSYMGQLDKRVDAIVAWDNLCDPADCVNGTGPEPKLRAPALGISSDYSAGPVPNPLAQDEASKQLSAAGIDTGQLFIRGGTHYEYSYAPMEAFPATLRGIHLAAWYTTAWFDKYLQNDPTADRRLISSRWRQDRGDRRVDPEGGGNLFSAMHPSRMDIRLTGSRRFECDDLRAGCPEMISRDGGPAEYSFLPIVTSPDRP